MDLKELQLKFAKIGPGELGNPDDLAKESAAIARQYANQEAIKAKIQVYQELIDKHKTVIDKLTAATYRNKRYRIEKDTILTVLKEEVTYLKKLILKLKHKRKIFSF